MSLSRRDLLRRGMASAAAFGMADVLGLPGAGTGTARAAQRAAVAGTGGVDRRLLPSPRALYRDVKRMVDLGPRHPGNDAHTSSSGGSIEASRGAGLPMLPRDDFPFTRWLADDWSPSRSWRGRRRGIVPVAGYQPYSGNTSRSGVVAELVYLGPAPPLALHGDPRDVEDLRASIEIVRTQLADWAEAAIAGIPGGVAGKIVLVDSQEAPLTERHFAALETYHHDPDTPILATPDFKRLALSAIPPASVIRPGRRRGSIVTLDASDAAAAGTHGPYGPAITGMPGLLVGRETGAKLRRFAEARPKTRLTLLASVKPSSTSPARRDPAR